MKTSGNYATYPGPGRLEALKQSVDSIIDQVDIVRIFWNEYLSSNLPNWAIGNYKIRNVLSGEINRKDNGKFLCLGFGWKEYYFTCDDKLIYPKDYVDTTIDHLKNRSIVCYHGRILKSDGNFRNSYYLGGHHCYGYQNDVEKGMLVHVAGTGVMAIDTREFNYKATFMSKFTGMSDLVFSLEVAKKSRDIYLAPHKSGWIRSIKLTESICIDQQKKDQTDQIKMVEEIMKLKGLL